GWGVPIATDIAFAVGVLALLGKRVPPALRVLLLALAVIDDLGAILVIACFYSTGIAVSGLVTACLAVALIFALRAMGVRNVLAYGVPAVFVWLGVHSAGIHPTIAGVIVGLSTPVKAWLGAEGFVDAAREQAQRVSDQLEGGHSGHTDINRPLHQIVFASREAVSPAEFLIDTLHPWVAYLIMPVFALANAGVNLHGLSFEGAGARVTAAICAALVLGKPIGVIATILLALAVGLAVLPAALHRRHLVVLGVVAGIGFTMSLFIAQLAFSDPALLGAAKLGVLAASAIAMIAGLGVGLALLPRPQFEAPAPDDHSAGLAS
ncbi:MAG TPA: Na+/H+ antiporter NhaA, partial [Polyangiaceae bacterium]